LNVTQAHKAVQRAASLGNTNMGQGLYDLLSFHRLTTFKFVAVFILFPINGMQDTYAYFLLAYQRNHPLV
jgi:hypothetical protein